MYRPREGGGNSFVTSRKGNEHFLKFKPRLSGRRKKETVQEEADSLIPKEKGRMH